MDFHVWLDGQWVAASGLDWWVEATLNGSSRRRSMVVMGVVEWRWVASMLDGWLDEWQSLACHCGAGAVGVGSIDGAVAIGGGAVVMLLVFMVLLWGCYGGAAGGRGAAVLVLVLLVLSLWLCFCWCCGDDVGAVLLWFWWCCCWCRCCCCCCWCSCWWC